MALVPVIEASGQNAQIHTIDPDPEAPPKAVEEIPTEDLLEKIQKNLKMLNDSVSIRQTGQREFRGSYISRSSDRQVFEFNGLWTTTNNVRLWIYKHIKSVQIQL